MAARNQRAAKQQDKENHQEQHQQAHAGDASSEGEMWKTDGNPYDDYHRDPP
jgi:hypothetical protein